MPSSKSASKTFRAVLERSTDGLNWTIIRVPLDVPKLWGVRGQLRVKGEINGFAFRTSLFPTGNGRHIMMVNRQMQKGGKTSFGMEARFRMEPDTEKREIVEPAELTRILKQSKSLKKFYEGFNDSMRRDMAKFVGEPKSAESRKRRAEQLAERMLLTMEGERELPPMLQAAFVQSPLARKGWEKMPASHRRSHLMGIYGYKSPESRAKRLAKAVEEMMQYAEKGKSPGREELD
ncbi:MAG TPA: YdeI/OmpD-associated family protein [Candidatus Limnocylindrales bacterium]|jgi:uncharacterized protein YdeI (YjbR/CyaY-like superfamily)|nr:YdeI/OmpD-associated family protein [Candidatus Limnocylindrales bacterium]